MDRDEVLNKLRTVGLDRALARSPMALVDDFVASMADSTGDAQATAAAFLEFRADWLAA